MLLDLPQELIDPILDRLHSNDVLRFANTCQLALSIVKDMKRWKCIHRTARLPCVKPKARKIKKPYDVCVRHLCHVCFRNRSRSGHNICYGCQIDVKYLTTLKKYLTSLRSPSTNTLYYEMPLSIPSHETIARVQSRLPPAYMSQPFETHWLVSK